MRFLFLLFAFFFAGCGLQVHDSVWNLPTAFDEDSFHTVNIREFAEDVRASTAGQLSIRVRSGGSMYSHTEIKDAVSAGKVSIGEFQLSNLSDENPIFAIDSVPFLASNYEKASTLWEASRPAIAELLDRQGLKVLFAVPWPPQGFYSNKPLKEIHDLVGMRIHAHDSAVEQLAVHAGAIPTQIPTPDIANAFNTGKVEAMINSPSSGASAEAWTFVNYFYHTQARLLKNVVVVNKDAFDRLDADVKRSLLAAAARAEARGWAASRAETSHMLDVLRENGMSVNRPENGLMQGLYKIGRKMTVDWTEKAGDDGIQIIVNYYANY